MGDLAITEYSIVANKSECTCTVCMYVLIYSGLLVISSVTLLSVYNLIVAPDKPLVPVSSLLALISREYTCPDCHIQI